MEFPVGSHMRVAMDRADYAASPNRIEEGEVALERAKKVAKEVGVEVQAKVFTADPDRYNFGPEKLIVKYALENDFDVLVVGSHGKTGISRVVLGSVSEYVAKHAHCPVIIVR
jgi:nucleotide-binding universal stress UspA family protein